MRIMESIKANIKTGSFQGIDKSKSRIIELFLAEIKGKANVQFFHVYYQTI